MKHTADEIITELKNMAREGEGHTTTKQAINMAEKLVEEKKAPSKPPTPPQLQSEASKIGTLPQFKPISQSSWIKNVQAFTLSHQQVRDTKDEEAAEKELQEKETKSLHKTPTLER